MTSLENALSPREWPFTFSLKVSPITTKNPPSIGGFAKVCHDRGKAPPVGLDYHVRFLCRLAFKRLRRLCCDIFRRRFFLRLPMILKVNREKCGLAACL